MPIQNRRFAARSHAVSPRRDTSPPASVPPRHSPHTPHLPRLTSTRDPRISQETCSRCAGARAPSRGRRASRPRVRLSRHGMRLFSVGTRRLARRLRPRRGPARASSAPPSRDEGAPFARRASRTFLRAPVARSRGPSPARRRTRAHVFSFSSPRRQPLRDALGFFAPPAADLSIDAHPDPSLLLTRPTPPSAVHSRVKMPSPQSVYTSLSIISHGGHIGMGVAVGSGVSMMSMAMIEEEQKNKMVASSVVEQSFRPMTQGFAASGSK